MDTKHTDTPQHADGAKPGLALADGSTPSYNALLDRIDLMVDEFYRIRACPGANVEIKGLCDRAIRNTYQHVPVIVQRDNAEALALRYRVALEEIADEALNHGEHNPISKKTRLPKGYQTIHRMATDACESNA